VPTRRRGKGPRDSGDHRIPRRCHVTA
jgi:hypothetical protein